MPRILCHGKPGHRRSASSPSRIAASLMSRSLRSTAAIVFGSSRKASKSMPCTNWTIMSMPSRISRRESAGSLKGKDGLTRGFGGNWLLEPSCRGKIHADTQHVRKAVFNGDHVQKRQTPSGSELGYDVHIRHLADSRPPRVGAVQEQMLDAGSFQLALVFPQLGNDCGLVHAAILLYILPHLKQPRNHRGHPAGHRGEGGTSPRSCRLLRGDPGPNPKG